jgi:hypothetical protein
MAEIAADPHFFTGTLELAGNGYTAHVSSATLKPTAKTAVFTDISGADTPLGGKSSWVLELNKAQDYATTNSLSKLLLANDGVSIAAELTTDEGTMAFDVIGTASDFGGTPGQIAVGTVSMPATYPVFTAAP